MKQTLIASVALVTLAVAAPALAGPPFLCHPFDIGSAKSLPWSGGNNWMTVNAGYEIANVVADTDTILTDSTPIPVRMETLRRASLYASRNRVVAQQLLSMLMSRAEQPGAGALALFDAGYVLEAFDEIEALAAYDKQFTTQARELGAVTRSHDAQAFLVRSQVLRPDDGAIDFALALLMRSSAARAEHVRKAQAAAQHDGLLASNLVKFQWP